jgi:hypothetical protein
MEPLQSTPVGLGAAALGGYGIGTLRLGESVANDILLSMFLLALGFFLVRDRDPGMSPKRQSWILSALTSMPLATLSMGHVITLLRVGWADVGRIVFADDRLARFLCCFFTAFLLLDVGFGRECVDVDGVGFLCGFYGWFGWLVWLDGWLVGWLVGWVGLGWFDRAIDLD